MLNRILLILSAVPTSRTYEVVVASVIIIITAATLFFLFRNVMKEIRRKSDDKHLVKKKDGKETVDDSRLIIERRTTNKKSGDLFGLINQSIYDAKEGSLGVLFYMNLDNFHFINEKYSEKETAKVLVEIEKRLKKKAGRGSVVGHVERDTFLYYHTDQVTSEGIRELAESLLDTVNEPLKAINERITTSMGVALFPYDGISATSLIKNAEIALYVSKKEGKNRYSLYSQDLIDKEQFNMSYYQEIKRSISNDEFILYYQPIVDLKTGKIIALESLLRWNHPTMGVLPPGRFLNVMDLTGDITWFGSWGFEKILQQYTAWKKQFRLKDVFISTNLSPKQLIVPDLAKTFYDIVKKYEFSAELFCLEIIDYYTIVKSPIAMANLAEFRKYGFRIAIDDLGDQFEIINDMDSLKASIIKINRDDTLKVMNKFEEADKIIRSIQTALQKQKVVIVEGIENEEMIKKMAEYDVRFMQGYFFSTPKAADKIGEILQKTPWEMDSFVGFYN
ncbi:MAG: bifunctional diguanylate cyclase/phosphodiesterase [Bacilli bacterium]|nr:bifunctional diguanylate cyclase/phosphodiesterase [Bacilli bacterium]MBN2696902.1 bifunctional diguanylate cyclase/phosphodiesterase [Bacilli bacterium]